MKSFQVCKTLQLIVFTLKHVIGFIANDSSAQLIPKKKMPVIFHQNVITFLSAFLVLILI